MNTNDFKRIMWLQGWGSKAAWTLVFTLSIATPAYAHSPGAAAAALGVNVVLAAAVSGLLKSRHFEKRKLTARTRWIAVVAASEVATMYAAAIAWYQLGPNEWEDALPILIIVTYLLLATVPNYFLRRSAGATLLIVGGVAQASVLIGLFVPFAFITWVPLYIMFGG